MDPTGIFDLPNTSLIFWEVITFAILLALLYYFVWPPIKNQIRQRQQSIEQAIDEAEQTRTLMFLGIGLVEAFALYGLVFALLLAFVL